MVKWIASRAVMIRARAKIRQQSQTRSVSRLFADWAFGYTPPPRRIAVFSGRECHAPDCRDESKRGGREDDVERQPGGSARARGAAGVRHGPRSAGACVAAFGG